MTELKIPPRPNLRPYRLTKEFMHYPGRNHPGIGKWLAETYTKPGDIIIDPMAGVGQMWLSAPKDRRYYLSDQNPDTGFGIVVCPAEQALPTQTYLCGTPTLVAFSPEYPQSHNAGKTAHQIQMRDEKGDHAIQGFSGPGADMRGYRTKPTAVLDREIPLGDGSLTWQ